MFTISPDRLSPAFTPSVMVTAMRGRTPAEPQIDFPNRLREWRNTRGLSLKKLAELTSQKHQSVARHETGENQITMAQMETYARALNIKPEELLRGSQRIPASLRDIVGLLENLPLTEQERLVGMVRAFAEPRPAYIPAAPVQKERKRRA